VCDSTFALLAAILLLKRIAVGAAVLALAIAVGGGALLLVYWVGMHFFPLLCVLIIAVVCYGIGREVLS